MHKSLGLQPLTLSHVTRGQGEGETWSSDSDSGITVDSHSPPSKTTPDSGISADQPSWSRPPPPPPPALRADPAMKPRAVSGGGKVGARVTSPEDEAERQRKQDYVRNTLLEYERQQRLQQQQHQQHQHHHQQQHNDNLYAANVYSGQGEEGRLGHHDNIQPRDVIPNDYVPSRMVRKMADPSRHVGHVTDTADHVTYQDVYRGEGGGGGGDEGYGSVTTSLSSPLSSSLSSLTTDSSTSSANGSHLRAGQGQPGSTRAQPVAGSGRLVLAKRGMLVKRRDLPPVEMTSQTMSLEERLRALTTIEEEDAVTQQGHGHTHLDPRTCSGSGSGLSSEGVYSVISRRHDRADRQGSNTDSSRSTPTSRSAIGERDRGADRERADRERADRDYATSSLHRAVPVRVEPEGAAHLPARGSHGDCARGGNSGRQTAVRERDVSHRPWGEGSDRAGGRGEGSDRAGGRGEGSDRAGGRGEGSDRAGGRGEGSDRAGGRGEGSDRAGGRGEGSDRAGGRGEGSDSAGGRDEGTEGVRFKAGGGGVKLNGRGQFEIDYSYYLKASPSETNDYVNTFSPTFPRPHPDLHPAPHPDLPPPGECGEVFEDEGMAESDPPSNHPSPHPPPAYTQQGQGRYSGRTTPTSPRGGGYGLRHGGVMCSMPDLSLHRPPPRRHSADTDLDRDLDLDPERYTPRPQPSACQPDLVTRRNLAPGSGYSSHSSGGRRAGQGDRNSCDVGSLYRQSDFSQTFPPVVADRSSLNLGDLPRIHEQLRATSEMLLSSGKRHQFASSSDIYRLFQGQHSQHSSGFVQGRQPPHRHSFHNFSSPQSLHNFADVRSRVRASSGSSNGGRPGSNQPQSPTSGVTSRPTSGVTSRPTSGVTSRLPAQGPVRGDHNIVVSSDCVGFSPHLHAAPSPSPTPSRDSANSRHGANMYLGEHDVINVSGPGDVTQLSGQAEAQRLRQVLGQGQQFATDLIEDDEGEKLSTLV